MAADQCGDISSDGSGAPEQFWNCAEVSIKQTVNSSTELHELHEEGDVIGSPKRCADASDCPTGYVCTNNMLCEVSQNQSDEVLSTIYTNPVDNSFFCGETLETVENLCLSSKPCPNGMAINVCETNERCIYSADCKNEYDAAVTVDGGPELPSGQPTKQPQIVDTQSTGIGFNPPAMLPQTTVGLEPVSEKTGKTIVGKPRSKPVVLI